MSGRTGKKWHTLTYSGMILLVIYILLNYYFFNDKIFLINSVFFPEFFWKFCIHSYNPRTHGIGNIWGGIDNIEELYLTKLKKKSKIKHCTHFITNYI